MRLLPVLHAYGGINAFLFSSSECRAEPLRLKMLGLLWKPAPVMTVLQSSSREESETRLLGWKQRTRERHRSSSAPRWGKRGVTPCLAGLALNVGGQQWRGGLDTGREAQQKAPHSAISKPVLFLLVIPILYSSSFSVLPDRNI